MQIEHLFVLLCVFLSKIHSTTVCAFGIIFFMKYKKFFVVFLLFILLAAQSALTAFAAGIDTAADTTRNYTAENYIVGDNRYYNFKSPAGVAAGEISIGAATVEFSFVADSETGIIYGFSSLTDYKEFQITNSNIRKPSRMRIIEKRFLLVLDGNDSQIHIFDWQGISGGALPAYKGAVTFYSDVSGGNETVPVKDFIIKSIQGEQQLFVISGDNLIQFGTNDFSNLVFLFDTKTDITVSGLNSDERPIALGFSQDYVYVLCTKSYVRFRISTTQQSYRPVLMLDRPLDIAVLGDNLVLIADNDGIKSYVPDGTARIRLPRRAGTTTGAVRGGEIITVGSLSYSGGKLYTADISAHARCVQKFSVDGAGALSYDNFYLGSAGGDNGRLYGAADVATKENKIYVADTQNNRLQIWEENEFVGMIPLDEYSPVAVTVTLTLDGDTQNTKIFVAANERILELSEDGRILRDYGTPDGQDFQKLTAIASSIDGTVYASDETAGIIYYKTPSDSGFKVFANNLPSLSALAVSTLNSNVFAAHKTQSAPYAAAVSVFGSDKIKVDALCFTLETIYTSITAIALDFKDTVFLYAETQTKSQLMKLSFSGGTYTRTNYDNTAETLKNIQGAAISEKTGMFFIADLNNNVIKYVEGSQLGIIIPGDIPDNLVPPVYIKNINLDIAEGDLLPVDYIVGVAAAANYTGWIIYPIDASQSTHENYPDGYALTEITNIGQGEKLLVLDTSDDLYAYVLYKGKAGFILKSGIDITPRDEDDRPAYPDEFALTLYSDVEIFKYPCLLKDADGKYSYSLKKLPKDTLIKLICRVPDYSENNTYFYEIEYCTDDSDPDNLVWQTAFVRRYQITPNVKRTIPDTVYGRISAPKDTGLVSVYEIDNTNSLSPDFRLRDNTEVVVIDDPGKGWIQVQWTAGGETMSGWIESKYLIYTGLTAMQVIGLVILLLAAVTAFLTLRLRKRKISAAEVSEQVRF